MGAEHRSGSKNGTPWEMIEITAVDAGEAPFCKTPLVFNLHKQDMDMGVALEGKTLRIAVIKVDTFNGRLDVQARIKREDYEAQAKEAPSQLPVRPVTPMATK